MSQFDIIQSRSCGPCSLCCSENPVPELNKGPRQRCDKQKERGGCEGYESRPKSCREYNCAWKSEMLPEWASPANIGLICDLQVLTVPPILSPRLTWVVRELAPNQASTEGAALLIGLLCQTGLTGAQGIVHAEQGNIPVVLVQHGDKPGHGRVIEGVVADTAADALVTNKGIKNLN